MATDHQVSHGRDIVWTVQARQAPEHIRDIWSGTSWIVELQAIGTCDGNPFQASHLFLSSLHTTPEALLRPVRNRWSVESWHWITGTQLHEPIPRYGGNGAGELAPLRTAALNLLRFVGFQSIRSGMQSAKHDITSLLAMARRRLGLPAWPALVPPLDAAARSDLPQAGAGSPVPPLAPAMVQSGPFGQHGSGFQASGPGAVQRHMKDKLAESVSALDFGARGDGKTDDTAAIQRALDAHPLVLLPPGTYAISDTLMLRRSGGGLVGSGALPALRMDRAGRSAIRLAPPPGGLAEWIRVDNLAIWLGPQVNPAYASQPSAGACAIAIDGSGSSVHAAGVQRSVLRNLRLLGWACGVWMRRHVNTLLERIVVEHWRPIGAAGPGRFVGFSLSGDPAASPPGAGLSPQASLEVVQCLFNGDGAPAGVTSIGFHLHGPDVRDVYFDRCETAGGDYGWLIEGSSGDYDWNIHLRRPVVDRFGRHAVALRDLSGPGAVSIQGGYTVPARGAGAALAASNCTAVSVAAGLQVLGLAGDGAGGQGLRLERCRHSAISGVTFLNQRIAVELQDCSGCSVSGCSIHAASTFFDHQPALATAIRIAGASRACLISGNSIAGLDGSRRYAVGIAVDEPASDCLVLGNAVDSLSVAEPYRVDGARNGLDALLANGRRRLSAPQQELISTAAPQVYRGTDPAFPHRFEDGQGQELVRLSSSGSWISRSDARLKTAITPIPYGLAQLCQLQPRAYRYRPASAPASAAASAPGLPAPLAPGAAAAVSGSADGTPPAEAGAAGAGIAARQLGLLAQEVRAVLPELVSEVDSAGELGLDYVGLVPVLIRAVQELDARLQQLETAAVDRPTSQPESGPA